MNVCYCRADAGVALLQGASNTDRMTVACFELYADAVQGAREQTTMHSAYDQTLKDLVARRLRQDPDYDPAKYPNIHAFFG